MLWMLSCVGVRRKFTGDAVGIYSERGRPEKIEEKTNGTGRQRELSHEQL